MAAALQRLLLTAWVGALWAIGYLAVPVLFAALDDRMLAGALAGRMFALAAWLGLACGGLLLLSHALSAARLPRRVLACVLAMLMLTAVGHFGLQPVMAGLKAQAGGAMEGALRERFALWHGVSSALYLVQSVLGALAVWWEARRTALSPGSGA